MRLKELWKEFLIILNDRRAEARFEWIDHVLYFISGRTRVIVEEHFAEEGQTAEELVEKTVIYENTHGGNSTNMMIMGDKVS